MKAILRSITLMAVTLFTFQQTKAQCTVSDIIIQNVSVAGSNAPGTCTVTFDASFRIENNNGNKYIFIHAWTQQDYPNYFQCNNGHTTLNGSIRAPKSADLGNEFLTIGINNDVDPPTLLPTYTPDPTVPITPVNSITRSIQPDGSAIFTLHGVTTTVPVTCGTPVVIVADLWSSQAANAQRAHCVNCGIQQSAGYFQVQGLANCATLQYGATITKLVPQPINGTTTVYADINGDNVYTPGVDTAISATTPFSMNGGMGSTMTITGPIPVQNRNQDLFVVIEQTSGAGAGSMKVTLIPSTQCGPLPVNFRSFTAARNNRSTVALRWETATENNNSGFAIQRTLNGNTWEVVSFVPSQATGGNSSDPIVYTFVDLNSNKGMSQYRIRQVDLDGKSKFSEVRSVRGEGQDIKMVVYPNPSTDGRFNIVFEDREGTRDVALLDMSGRVLKQWQQVTGNTIQVENLRPGMYSVRVTIRETGAQSFEKIIVTK